MSECASNDNRIAESTYSVHAVIFGADQSLLGIHLKDGFSFRRVSLNPAVSNLDKILETTDFGLRREYETARIDEESLDVICAVKETGYTIHTSRLQERFSDDVDDDLLSLDNQIRIIRLLQEGPVRFKKIAFHQKSKLHVDGVIATTEHNSILPIGEASTTKPYSCFHCNDEEAAFISEKIQSQYLPFNDIQLNACHMYYDLSYHTEAFVSITLLLTALEMLFLERNSGGKQKPLAKRCAVFLYENDLSKAREAYRRLFDLYGKRSDFVHEGKISGIQTQDIIELRAYVRDSLLRVLSLSENKTQRISRLKCFVEQNQALFGE